MAQFSVETVRLAKLELDESLSRMQQQADELRRRGERAEKAAQAQYEAAGEKLRHMQEQLDRLRMLSVENQAVLYRLEDALGSAFREREAALCREQTARDALEEAQRRYNEAKAMTLPPSSDPSYGFLEQGKRVAMKKAARQISDAQERIRAARQEAEQLAERTGHAAPRMEQCKARLAQLGAAILALGGEIRRLERFRTELAAGLEAYESQAKERLSGMEQAIRQMEEPQQLGEQAWKAVSAYADAMGRIRY